ncbi:MAG: hypothetical protein V4471_04855 [Pseudomonadota bacterium]
MFRQNKSIYFIEIFWLFSLIIFASLIYLNQKYIGLFFNSDHLMFPSVFKDLFLNQGHYKDWSLSPAPHFFPDIFTFSPAFLLTKDIYFQFLITLCLQLVFLYLAVKYLYSQFFSKTSAIVFSLASASIFYLLTFKKPASILLAAGPLIPAGHMGEFIVGIFVVGMQLKIINYSDNLEHKNNLLLLGTALSFLCSLSDWLFFIQFSAAIFFIYLFLYINRSIKFKVVRHYALLPFMASIAGVFFTKHVVPADILSGYLSHPSLEKISIDTIHNQFLMLINLFKMDLNWFTGIQSILFYSGVFFLFFIHIKTKKTVSSLDIKLRFLSGFIIFSSSLSIISIFLLAQENYVQDKYLFPLFFFPVLLFFYLNTKLVNFRFIYNSVLGLAGLVILVVLFYIITLPHQPGFKIKLSYYPSYITCIDQTLHGHDPNGIAQYWDARLISMLSREKLQVMPVLSNLVNFPFAINRKRYRSTYAFAIIDTSLTGDWLLDQTLIESINGRPEKTVYCGSKKILIYQENKLKVHV